MRARDVDLLDLALELDADDALSERARERLDPALLRIPEVRRRADLNDVFAHRTRNDSLDVGSRTRRSIQPNSISRGSTVQIFRAYGIIRCSAIPSPKVPAHPLLVVLRPELPACLPLDRPDESAEAIDDDLRRQAV